MSEEYDYYAGLEADNMTNSDSVSTFRADTEGYQRAVALHKWNLANGICIAPRCGEKVFDGLLECERHLNGKNRLKLGQLSAGRRDASKEATPNPANSYVSPKIPNPNLFEEAQ